MLFEITQVSPSVELGLTLILQHLSITGEQLRFVVDVTSHKDISGMDLSLILTSGSFRRAFPFESQKGVFSLKGDVATHDLMLEASFCLVSDSGQNPWLKLKFDNPVFDRVHQWKKYFSGQSSKLSCPDMGVLASQFLKSANVINILSPPTKYSVFCNLAASSDFVVRLARLCRHGYFPGITSTEDCVLLASKLVLLWNVLLIQDGGRRIFVFQGVTSCDAVFIPDLNDLIINCHITREQIIHCLQSLFRTPEFFNIVKPRSFSGFLVGHSRPYHCNYDSLLALQHVREAGQLLPEDSLFSKSDEAFIDLGSALGLSQPHQCQKHSM